jgi:glutamate carboxypeptidase
MTIKKLLLSFLTFIFFQTACANTLSEKEKQITSYISQKKSEQLALLKKTVNINSGTTNLSGVHQTEIIFQKELNKLGFKTHWVEEPKKFRRAGTLVAIHKGTTGKRILLIGHLDTVFSKDNTFQKFSRKGNLATGPGVIDEKGGDVVILYALKALKAAHVLDQANIIVVLTGDEEDSGKPTSISRKPLFDAAKQSDIALDFEQGATNNAVIGRRGISHWKIETTGFETHSSEIFQQGAGYGAIFELSRILDAMRLTLSHEKYLTFNPGVISGGSGKENIVAKSASASGDLRFLTEEQKVKAEKEISKIVKQHLPKTSAAVTFGEEIPAMPPTKNNLALLKQYSQVSQDLGYGSVKPVDPAYRGAADISHIAAITSANLSGLGAIGDGSHSQYETVEIPSLTMQTQRAAVLIYRLINASSMAKRS